MAGMGLENVVTIKCNSGKMDTKDLEQKIEDAKSQVCHHCHNRSCFHYDSILIFFLISKITSKLVHNDSRTDIHVHMHGVDQHSLSHATNWVLTYPIIKKTPKSSQNQASLR